MARKRAVKQRLDLRKGGRVQTNKGMSLAQRKKILGQNPTTTNSRGRR